MDAILGWAAKAVEYSRGEPLLSQSAAPPSEDRDATAKKIDEALRRRRRVIDRDKPYLLTIRNDHVRPRNGKEAPVIETREVTATEAIESKLQRELGYANTKENKQKVKKRANFSERGKEFNLDQKELKSTISSTTGYDLEVDGRNLKCTIQQATDIGLNPDRPQNEDRLFVSKISFKAGGCEHTAVVTAVMDGHGGEFSAEGAHRNLLRELTQRLEYYNEKVFDDVGVFNALKRTPVLLEDDLRRVNNKDGSGTTLNLSVIIDGKDIWTANTGDSRAILVELTDDLPVITQLSQDQGPRVHRFQRNLERFESYVAMGRVDGFLALARGLGAYGGYYHFTSRPKVIKVPVPRSGKFAVVQASDGMWDVMSSEATGKAVAKAFKENQQNIAGRLIAKALAPDRGSSDNVSVIFSTYQAGA